jgi:hypothetical protein
MPSFQLFGRLLSGSRDLLPATCKVCEVFAENPEMNSEPFQRPGNDDPLRAEARSLAASVEAIRRARGKKNPRDFAVDTPEWEATCIEFARDLRWALGMSGDDWTDVPSIESQVRRLPR